MSKLNHADQSRNMITHDGLLLILVYFCFQLFGVGSCHFENLARDFTIGRYEGIESVKKTIGLVGKTKTLHVHRTFLYIYLRFLNNYDVKLPNFKV